MDYEGKNKIIYIGTVVLAIALVLIYAIYFIKQNHVKNETSSNRVVVSDTVLNSKEITDQGEKAEEIVNEIIALEIQEDNEETVEEVKEVTKSIRNIKAKDLEVKKAKNEINPMEDVIIEE